MGNGTQVEKRMHKVHDIFGPGSNFEGRVFRNYDRLSEQIESCKRIGLRIVLTSGTFDLFHVGHSRYLEKAKEHGDILVVGVDDDEKVREKKGAHRPIVGQEERMEILCHSRHVDIVFLKQAKDPKWHLIKVVRPATLIATKRIYGNENDLDDLREFCGKVVILESQASTSTTAKIRNILIGPVEKIKEKLKATTEEVCIFLDDLTGKI